MEKNYKFLDIPITFLPISGFRDQRSLCEFRCQNKVPRLFHEFPNFPFANAEGKSLRRTSILEMNVTYLVKNTSTAGTTTAYYTDVCLLYSSTVRKGFTIIQQWYPSSKVFFSSFKSGIDALQMRTKHA